MVKDFILKVLSYVIKADNNSIVFYDNRMYPDMIYAVLKGLYKSNSPLKRKKIHLILSDDSLQYYREFKGIKNYKRRSISGTYHLLHSKLVFTDGYFGEELQTNGRILINLWHGLGLKKILHLSNQYQETEKHFTTYTFSYSKYFNEVTAKAFNIEDANVFATGSPRNDLFKLGVREDLDRIRTGISSKSKVVIWMPTYRVSSTAISQNDGKAYEYGIPLINSENIIKLNEYLKEEDIILLIKYHVLQNNNSVLENNLSNIVIVTSRDIGDTGLSLYQLIGQCDGLITDYSSIYFEYLSLNKPICFAYDDLEEYDSKRGFMFEDVKKIMPGVHATSYKKLVTFFAQIKNNEDCFYDERTKITNEMGLYKDENNVLRLIQEIDKLEL